MHGKLTNFPTFSFVYCSNTNFVFIRGTFHFNRVVFLRLEGPLTFGEVLSYSETLVLPGCVIITAAIIISLGLSLVGQIHVPLIIFIPNLQLPRSVPSSSSLEY